MMSDITIVEVENGFAVYDNVADTCGRRSTPRWVFRDAASLGEFVVRRLSPPETRPASDPSRVTIVPLDSK